MLKKRFLRVLTIFLLTAVYFSLSSESVTAQCCVFAAPNELVSCQDLGFGETQSDCEALDGEFYSQACSDIGLCAPTCTSDLKVNCPDGSQITSALCQAGAYMATGETCPEITNLCLNSVKDVSVGETDVDCGGSCQKCPDGKSCLADADCTSGNCADGVCQPEVIVPEVKIPTCGNGVCDVGENYQTCIYDCGTCGDSIVYNEECEKSSDCYGGTCSRCKCSYSCIENPPAPVNLFVSSIRGKEELRVTWNLGADIGCDLNKQLVYRCGQEGIKADCTPSRLVNVAEEKLTSYSYTDKDVAPDTRYCYRVDAYYGEAGTKVSSQAICGELGVEGCLADNSYFCENNILYSCDPENHKQEVQNCSSIKSDIGQYYCSGPDTAGNAECVLQNNCDLCNGLFGLFGLYGETMHMLIAPLGGQTAGFVPCDEAIIKSCYFDSTKTNVDKYSFCSNVDSCYDYSSEAACAENKCDAGKCEWEESDKAGAELGIGVCRPAEAEKQECSLCDTDISPERNLFFGTCSDDTCKLYGDCYYAKNSWGGLGCTSKSMVGCRAYTGKDDCINADETGAKEIDIDASYDESGKRVSGTNVITQESNDYFKFGTCKWGVDEFGSTTCVKDADGNEKADCSVYDTVCQADNLPPETMIVPDAAADSGRLILGRDVYIKLETSEPAITYFCFAKEGQTCYPAESTACGIQKSVDYSGAYTMFYYSEDRAHNIEEVKSIDVAFDSKIPAITAGKQIYNKRTEIITLTTDSEVTCSARLEDDLGVPAYPDVVIDKVQLRAGSSISRTYTNLPDDNYHFVYECSNRAGNKADGVVSFSIDNNRIHDPKPVNPVTKTAVDMSVGTDQLAECKYSPTTGTDQRYDSMQFSFIDSPDGLSHTTTQYVLLETPYSFDVKCRFADGIEGENNDRIRFAVDSKPPAVEAVSTFAAYGFDQSQTYGSKQTLMIQCSDNWFLKNRNVKGMDLGCDRTTYTYTDPSTGNDVTKELSGEGLSDPFTVDSTQLIRFTTNDLGGNTETNAINVQINVLPTILDIDVFKAPMTGSSEPLKAVAYGDYIIKLSSSKNLVAAIADVRVEGDQIYNIPVRFFRSEDFGKTQLFTFTIPWSLPGMLDKILGINVTAVVAMPGEFCSVEAAAEENKYYYAEKLVFDTTVPEADLAPALDKYNSKPYFYPLNEEGGIYYTNQNLLFVTGKAKAGTAKVNYYVGQRLTDIKLQQRYDLAQNANPKETGSLTNFQGNIGETFVYNFLAGISGFGVMPGNYLEFKDPRTSYGHYKEYYRIIDIDGQQVELEYPLEKDVNLKDTAKVFNAAHPSDWFGANIGLERGTNYFFIRPESSGGQEGYLDKIYTIVYDPQPPEVIKQVPQKGFSENKNTIISIIVRKPIGSSQLDTSNVKLYLNGKTAKLEKITNISDGQYYYYNITHIPATLDGTYIVNFTGFDYALNPLTATSSASPKWIFTVNKDSPMAPVFDVRDGVYYNGVWFTKKSPEFSLFFQDAIDVEITAYYNNFVGNYINVPACKETADANYFTGCRFDPELVPNVVGPGGSFVENEYQIIVEARKLFEDGAEGPRSPLFLDKLVIDDVAPDIGSVVYPDKIRGDYDIVFDAVVNNEVHDLNATLLFKNRYYILTQVGRAGRHYYFKWTTPALDFSDPAIKREYEGDTTLSLKIADYAGNYDTADLQTYMDLSLPNVKDLHVSVMPTRILDTGLVTNQTEIRVRGNFTDDDVRSVYIIPGDYVFVPGKRPILEDISELANIVGNTFELTMLINGTFNTTTLNKLNVYMEDDAGNAAFTPLYVVADLQPPYVVSTAIS